MAFTFDGLRLNISGFLCASGFLYYVHTFDSLSIQATSKCTIFQFKSYGSEGKDALHKTRPLLNILKKTVGVFLIPGLELSLDEASCASRSSYGRELICFNPAKNCSKFYFRFYLLCDASTFACSTIKLQQEMTVTTPIQKRLSRVSSKKQIIFF
jgi:hypothetical protein